MAFKKGQSGNPGGRPKKGVSLTSILRELGDLRDVTINGEKIERKRALGESLWKRAITDGDFQCAKFIFERLDGLPKPSPDDDGVDTRLEIVIVDKRSEN